MQRCKELIHQLDSEQKLTKEEYQELFQQRFSIEDEDQRKEIDQELFELVRRKQQQTFGKGVYLRGLIEFTNYCRNNCYYCGIRAGNREVERYRLTKEQILDCCQEGYTLGFRTFVLQGGEDPHFTNDMICDIVSSIKERHPDCAITLSIGEWDRESYERFYQAGADRYLLRHETANAIHYGQLHPPELSVEHRKNCLRILKEIGYQVGAGIMVGSPGQTLEHLAEDMMFLLELQPHMIGIGPFISHKDTPFADQKNGSVEMTLFLLGVLRLTFPKVLLPATTALGTLAPDGRERGILAGANVLMPNLSPVGVRKQYSLYDNKICTGEESAQCIHCVARRVQSVGYEVLTDRGDYPGHAIH